MIAITPQYIKDTAGKQLVVFPAKQFNKLMKQLEELDNIKLYDIAKKRKQNFVDADIAFNKIETKRNKNV